MAAALPLFVVLLLSVSALLPSAHADSKDGVVSPQNLRELSRTSRHLLATQNGGAEVDPQFTPPKGATYLGGPVMVNRVNLYVLWYGNWSNETASQKLIREFLLSLDRTNTLKGGPTVRGWFNILRQYYDGNNDYVQGDVTLKQEAYDAYSHGLQLFDYSQFSPIEDAVNAGVFPADKNGIYLMYPSADVHHFHPGFYVPDVDLQYYEPYVDCVCRARTFIDSLGANAFIAYNSDNEYCASPCGVLIPSANTNPAADDMIFNTGFAIQSIVVNPHFDAWRIDQNCVYSQVVYNNPPDGRFNVFGRKMKKFLLGPVWDISKGSCVIQGSEAVNRTNVGTYYKMYGRRYFRSPVVRQEAGLPNRSCYRIALSPLGSFVIRWNVDDRKPNHVGCRRVTLWANSNCTGTNTTYALPGGIWNPLNFAYPDTKIRILPHAVASASCRGAT